MALFGKKKDSSSDLLKGFRRPDRYRLLRAIGEGGLARVSSVFDSYLNRVVASKELKEEIMENPNLLKLFVTEVKLIGYLDHPGVIPIFDTYLHDDGTLCYTMKLFEGKRLTDLLEACANVEPHLRDQNLFLDIFVKLCETMAYVHDKGVVHLDLKPDNIMIGEYGEVMVMDWGNARLFDSKQYREYLSRYTDHAEEYEFAEEEKGVIVGTPLYMSPEQTNQQRQTLRPASDIFSLGVVLYEMMSGRMPFTGESFNELSENIRTAECAPLHEVNSNVPRRLSQISERMLAKAPADRYASFHEVLADIAEYRNSGQGFSARMFTPGEVIFREGDVGDYAFAIISGKVEIAKISAGKRAVLAQFGPGELVGELAIFSKVPRTATATAVEQTAIRIMNRAEVEKELEKLSPWVGQMIATLCHRFIAQTDRIISLERSRGTAE